jgi:fucose permease
MAIKGKEHFVNAIIQISYTVGAILLPLFFLFFGIWQKWRFVYLTIALFIFAAFFLSRGTIEKNESQGLIHSLKNYPKYFTKGRCMLGAVVLFFYLAAEIGLWSLAPTLFESTGGGQISGIISSFLVWVMMFLGRSFGAFLMRRFSIIQILIPFGIFGIASYVMVLFTSGPLAIAAVALGGFACAPFYGFLLSWATMVANDKSSSYLGFIMAFGTVGPVLLGWVISLLGDLVAGRLMVLPALCCFIIMMILLSVFGPRYDEKRKR